MKRILAEMIIFALTLLSACGAASAPPAASAPGAASWQSQYDLGLRLLSEGNYEEAIIAFTAAIEINPKQAPAYVGRGDVYVQLAVQAVEGGDETESAEYYAQAEPDYLTAIGLDKLSVATYNKLADVYLALGDLDAACAILQQGYDSTGDESLQFRLEELDAIEQELPFISLQQAYRADGSLVYTASYEYDKNGYMVYEVMQHYNENSVSYVSDIEAWSYDPENDLWTSTDWEGNPVTDQWRMIGPYEWTVGVSSDNTDCWIDPYYEYANQSPETFKDIADMITTFGSVERPQTIYNEEHEEYPDSWHHATYTYDATGNAVRIDSYFADGTQSGYCILSYTTVSVKR